MGWFESGGGGGGEGGQWGWGVRGDGGRDGYPIGGGVAIAALPAGVSIRADMTGFAVGIACVVEMYLGPVFSFVAIGALARPVTTWGGVTPGAVV